MLAVGTRFWDARNGSSPEIVLEFVKRVSEFADLTIIAVNEKEDKSGSLDALRGLGLQNLLTIPVKPWGYTFAMNALVYTADLTQQRYLLSHSVEIRMSKQMADALLSQMDDATLCVGARLPGHEFYPGRMVPGTGVTVPWNTCALWNLRRLACFGFPLIGDASFDATQAGVEEVTAIALLQSLRKDCGVKLMEVPGIEWQTEFQNDPARRIKHERKMRLKVQRPRLQLGLLGLGEPGIEHIGSK